MCQHWLAAQGAPSATQADAPNAATTTGETGNDLESIACTPCIAQGREDVLSFLEKWITLCWDADGSHGDMTTCSPICLAGEALCCLFASVPAEEWPCETDVGEVLGIYQKRILIHGSNLASFSWHQLVDTISAVQLEFSAMMQLGDGGFDCAVDLTAFLIAVMRRLGHFTLHAQKVGPGDGHEFYEHLGIADESATDGGGTTHAIVSDTAFCHQMYAIHALMRAVYVLTRAIPVAGDTQFEVQSHHREASLDDFYELSMLCDLSPGFVVQYKFRFAHLFHSTSQVVYFHYPQYQRKIQAPLAALQVRNCSHTHLLPLLRQVEPGIPLFFEHTGAGIQHIHAQHEWSWACFSGFFVLVHRSGVSYCAHDARSLLATAQNSPPARLSSTPAVCSSTVEPSA